MKFFNFSIHNLLIINLLIFVFGFASLNSQNHTIFLYGSIDGEYNKKDMQFLYTNIAQKIIENGGTTEFWPKRKTKFRKRNRFCNHRKINRAYKVLITNVYYRQLREQIIENYEETGEKVNIVAIGDGVKVLNNFLQDFYEMECNCINKAIIIENTENINLEKRMSNFIENIRCGHSVREYIPAEIVLLEQKVSRNLNRNILQEDSDLYLSDTEDHYSDEDSYLNGYEEGPDTTDLSNKVVVVNAQEYIELLEQQKQERSCCDWFTADRIKALTGLALIIIPLLAA